MMDKPLDQMSRSMYEFFQGYHTGSGSFDFKKVSRPILSDNLKLNSMTILDLIRSRVEGIKIIATDSEAAHCTEDEIREYALRLIVSGKYNKKTCQKIAQEALKTGTVKFFRWYA